MGKKIRTAFPGSGAPRDKNSVNDKREECASTGQYIGVEAVATQISQDLHGYIEILLELNGHVVRVLRAHFNMVDMRQEHQFILEAMNGYLIQFFFNMDTNCIHISGASNLMHS